MLVALAGVRVGDAGARGAGRSPGAARPHTPQVPPAPITPTQRWPGTPNTAVRTSTTCSSSTTRWRAITPTRCARSSASTRRSRRRGRPGGRGGSPQCYPEELWRTLFALGCPALHQQSQERPGSARSSAPHRLRPPSRRPGPARDPRHQRYRPPPTGWTEFPSCRPTGPPRAGGAAALRGHAAPCARARRRRHSDWGAASCLSYGAIRRRCRRSRWPRR